MTSSRCTIICLLILIRKAMNWDCRKTFLVYRRRSSEQFSSGIKQILIDCSVESLQRYCNCLPGVALPGLDYFAYLSVYQPVKGTTFMTHFVDHLQSLDTIWIQQQSGLYIMWCHCLLRAGHAGLKPFLVVGWTMRNVHKVICGSLSEKVNICPHGISSWHENNQQSSEEFVRAHTGGMTYLPNLVLGRWHTQQ